MSRPHFPILLRFARVWAWPLWFTVRHSRSREEILTDVHWWIDCVEDGQLTSLAEPARFAYLTGALPEFRTLVHYRLRNASPWFIRAAMRALYRAPKAILFAPGTLGPACFIQHGIATVVVANSIGHHFKIGQQVTVGHTAHGKPTIGNHVTIGAGALVLGNITVGDGAVIGAGAIVVDDVEPGAVMVSPKAVAVRQEPGAAAPSAAPRATPEPPGR